MDLNNSFFITKCVNKNKKACGHFASNLFTGAGANGQIVFSSTSEGMFLSEILPVLKRKTSQTLSSCQNDVDKIFNRYKGTLNLQDEFHDRLVLVISDKSAADKMRNLSTKAIEQFETNGKLPEPGETPAPVIPAAETDAGETLEQRKGRLIPYVEKLCKFFSEWNFEVSYRMLNTLAHIPTAAAKKDYLVNYLTVSGNPIATAVAAKMNDWEWKDIAENLVVDDTVPYVNKRLELYFGPAGTGKTTLGTELADITYLCASDTLPKSLLETFTFNDENGNPQFVPSEVWHAIEEGKVIFMDEFNMLPLETIKFMQGILDNKESFSYDGHEIKIHPDFKVIAAFNLELNNGTILPLPDPIVDRASKIKKFKLTANKLVECLC